MGLPLKLGIHVLWKRQTVFSVDLSHVFELELLGVYRPLSVTIIDGIFCTAENWLGEPTNNIHSYASANKALRQLIYTGTTFSFEQFWLPRDGGQSRTLGSTPLNCTPHVLHGWFSLRINAVGQRASAAFTALQYSTLSYNPLELFPDRAPRSQCEAKAPQTRNIPRSLQKFSLFPGLD